MKKLLLSCLVVTIFLFYSAAYCTYTGESPATDLPSSGDSLFTKYEDDLLSVDIKDVPLGEVLKKLSEETGIVFSFPPTLGEEKIMVRFSNFKIADALNKILGSHDRIFFYEEMQSDLDASLPGTLKEVRIYTKTPQGTQKGGTSDIPTLINSKSSQPNQKAKNNNRQKKVVKRSTASTSGRQTVASLADDLKDSDYRVRLESVRNLSRIGNADAIGHLTSALEDQNPEVRKAAQTALEDLQNNSSSETASPDSSEDDKNQLLESSPTFAVEVVSQDSGDIELGLKLSDVPEPLITAGLWIDYDASQMSIVGADIKGGDGYWDTSMSKKVSNPNGPGTYMVTVGNLSLVKPDDSSDINIANFRINCTGDCSGQTIKISTVPSFNSVVGDKAGTYDANIDPITFTLP